MKLFVDFLPLVFFFATYEIADSKKDLAITLANKLLGTFVRGGPITGLEAPILLATAVVIVSTLLLVAIMKLRGEKLDKLLWVNVSVITVLGVATLWFRNENFIKWKPTALYWITGVAFGFSELLTGKNLIQSMMGKDIEAPPQVWRVTSYAWAVFFILMGVLNLYVAYNYPLPTWVKFKVFGGPAITLIFIIAQGLYLSRHIKTNPTETDSPPVSG